MRPTQSTRIRAVSLAVLFLLAAVLAACGSQGSAMAPEEQTSAGGDSGSEEAGGAPVPASSAGGEATGGGPAGPDGNAAPIEQRIIKTGEVALEVDNVAVVLARVRGMAVELGGYVGGSQAGTLDESASLTLRVPAARFDELLARLHEMEDVKVVSESTNEQDVTREIVDLEARIRNLEASEESYRVLLDRAERIDDVLVVQSRLDEVRGQIEQLNGQLQTVEGQADLSTLTVTIIPRGEPIAAVHARGIRALSWTARSQRWSAWGRASWMRSSGSSSSGCRFCCCWVSSASASGAGSWRSGVACRHNDELDCARVL